jgi:serine/threonine-protein kinase
LEPKTAQQYSNLAQAYAHLGKYQKAVKTLKIANEKFSSVAELDYAASIVNTLASNYIAAIVDINDAVENGKAPIWFSFEWFTPLCEYQEFQNITGAATNKMCN